MLVVVKGSSAGLKYQLESNGSFGLVTINYKHAAGLCKFFEMFLFFETQCNSLSQVTANSLVAADSQRSLNGL